MEWLLFVPRHVMIQMIRTQKKPYTVEIAAVSLYLDLAANRKRSKRAYAAQWGWTERKVRYHWDELTEMVTTWASAQGRVPDNPITACIPEVLGDSPQSSPASRTNGAVSDAASPEGGSTDRAEAVNVASTSDQRRTNVAKNCKNKRKSQVHVSPTSHQRRTNVADPIISNLIKSKITPLNPPWEWGEFFDELVSIWRLTSTSRRKRTLAAQLAGILADKGIDAIATANQVLIQNGQLYAIQVDNVDSAPAGAIPTVLLAVNSPKAGRLAVPGFRSAWGLGLAGGRKSTGGGDLMTYEDALTWRDKHAPGQVFPGKLFEPVKLENGKVLWRKK